MMNESIKKQPPILSDIRSQRIYQKQTITPTIQAVLKHQHIATTMMYTHVLKQGRQGVQLPLDVL